ncbi:hypothetical protein ACFQY0_07520 [Haloferula chungangensis]|uniref:Uncharacterized protein n=1 Tax=Haloferula chungangensis TaxID=1048331 RepID=A0ABW2L791_9BACT
MKNSHVAVLVLGSVAVTAGIQEWRLGGEKHESEGALRIHADANHPILSSGDGLPERERPLSRSEKHPSDELQEEKEGFSKSLRKMWENPAGKSMMSQGVKMAVAMMYEDYVESLDLSEEEEKHFRDLLGREMMNQQEISMKLMSAKAEERAALVEEMTKRNRESEEDIKTFLNNEEDFEAYQSYKERLPERQQLEGLRATMSAKNAAMDETTESQLIEAMHKARTQPGLADFSGKNAILEVGKGNLSERFEESWESQQAMLRNEVDFLSEPQKEAFFEYQDQMKEFQMMGVKMTEQMMEKQGE